MSEQDDAPPAAAMAHLMRMLPPLETGMAFAGIKTLPAAARWRLIAWLATGLEPTKAMIEAGADSDGYTGSAQMTLECMLAAAAEAGDGE